MDVAASATGALHIGSVSFDLRHKAQRHSGHISTLLFAANNNVRKLTKLCPLGSAAGSLVSLNSIAVCD